MDSKLENKMSDYDRDEMARKSFQETRGTLQAMVFHGMAGIIFWLGLYNIFC